MAYYWGDSLLLNPLSAMTRLVCRKFNGCTVLRLQVVSSNEEKARQVKNKNGLSSPFYVHFMSSLGNIELE
jgi:hypothetical protein